MTLQNRPKLLIFDFDGCLYPYPDDCMEIFDRARTATGLTLSNGTLDKDTAYSVCKDSYLKHGFTFKTLCDQFGMSMGEASMINHAQIRFKLVPDPDLIDAFKTLDRKQIHLAILTQGSRCNLDYHLPLIGLDGFFPRHLRITVDDHGYERLKSNSEYPWLLAKWKAESASGIRFADEDIYAFEDTIDNLKTAHSLGWNTHLLHHGKPHTDLPAHILSQSGTATDFLRTLPQNPLYAPIAPEPLDKLL